MSGREFYVPEEHIDFIVKVNSEVRGAGFLIETYNNMVKALEDKVSFSDESLIKRIQRWNFAFEFSPLVVSAYFPIDNIEGDSIMTGILRVELKSDKDYVMIHFTDELRNKGLTIEKLPHKKNRGIVFYNGILLEEFLYDEIKKSYKNKGKSIILGGSYEQLLQ